MSSKAHVEYDPTILGQRLAVTRGTDYETRSVLLWEPVAVKVVTEATSSQQDDRVWLRLPEDDLRAIYEALADHFGHAGHDVRALRKDYDAERARVDKLIGNLIGGAR